VEHVAHNPVLLDHRRDGLGLVDAGVFAVLRRILRQRRLQVLRDAELVHAEASGLVTEHPVHPGNDLH